MVTFMVSVFPDLPGSTVVSYLGGYQALLMPWVKRQRILHTSPVKEAANGFGTVGLVSKIALMAEICRCNPEEDPVLIT